MAYKPLNREQFTRAMMRAIFEDLRGYTEQGGEEVSEVKYGTKDYRVIYVTILGHEYALRLYEFGGHPGGRRYPNLSTNADSIIVGSAITQAQVDALAQMEHEYCESRGMIPREIAEAVLHSFMCEAMGECVCSEPRPIHEKEGE